MKKGKARFFTLLVLAGMAMVLGVTGCADKKRVAVGKLDRPDRHAQRGNELMDAGRWERAEKSFKLALSLDDEYAPAIAGMAVATAKKSSAAGISADQREDLAEKSDDLIDDALGEAKDDQEKRAVLTAGIRVKRLSKMPEDSWVEEAADFHEDAVDLDERKIDPLPHFYLARAYRDAFQLRKAEEFYIKVQRMDRGKTKEADLELAQVQEIVRAEPGSRYGRLIAFEPSVSKADIAALFLSELKLAALFSRGDSTRFDNKFQASTRKTFKADSRQRVPDATDIKDHPLGADIEEILRLRVRGLEPDAAHLFHPDAKLLRGPFAAMVEDILVKVTGETKLQTRFFGQASPYPDVRSDVWYYNAVRTVISRGLMTAKNQIRGEFGPTDPVSGANALLVIKKLNNELKSYLRRS